MKKSLIIIFIVFTAINLIAQNSIITADDAAISAWASECTVDAGPVNMSTPASPPASFGEAANGIGEADGQVVSLGDKGSATLFFESGIADAEGVDFAVFENAIYSPPDQDSMVYAELAFVEVSSDGENFVRFPAYSSLPAEEQTGSFEPILQKLVYNLAGATVSFQGCGFDLAELADSSGIDITDITHVRIIDVGGSIDPGLASFDTNGNIINDPFPTEYASGGFDLDAVAVINNSTSIQAHSAFSFEIFPNPATSRLNIRGTKGYFRYEIYNSAGKTIQQNNQSRPEIMIDNLPEGYYFIRITNSNKTGIRKFVK